MLAKAVATECHANFINVSVASIASKWFGEGEKYAQAIFTLASKISPAGETERMCMRALWLSEFAHSDLH